MKHQGAKMILIKIIKFGDLNKLTYEDLVLVINMSSMVVKVAFSLVHNARSPECQRETV